MDNIRVVGFTGQAGSGKTTAAKYLIAKGYTWLRFSESLKTMLMLGLGIPREYVDGDKKNEPCEQLCGRTCRHAMITLGTEWGRELIHQDIWVRATERILLKGIEQGISRFVIDDFRFLSETEWLKQLDFQSERLIESCLIKIDRKNESPIDHKSETEQKEIEVNCMIYNDRTIEVLHKNIDLALEHLFKKE